MRQLVFLAAILILLASCAGSRSTHSFNKKNRSYYKSRYGSTIRKPKKVCRTVALNKRKKKNRKVRNGGDDWKNQVAFAEANTSAEYRKPAPKPAVKPVNNTTQAFDDQSIEEKHKKADEILEKNNLPKPTSEKHEEIRKLVENKIKGHKDGDPIKLEPLYFTFDEDEFAVVDMEPFLIAVEYALQGRIILIEGHTDSKGIDDYNVQLSIQRVEKIRQLMHDMGVPDERISVVGYGEELSAHDNTTEEGRQRNRRVDFTVF